MARWWILCHELLSWLGCLRKAVATNTPIACMHSSKFFEAYLAALMLPRPTLKVKPTSVRDNSSYDVEEQLPLSDEDIAEGVLSDQLVILGASSSKSTKPDHKIRIVVVQATPHTSRGKYKGGSTGLSSDGKMRLATNLLDVPAELISKLYRLRWMIELFFRTIKSMLHCDHLLSTKQNGVEIQAYMAIIACLIILIYTGGKPTKRTFEMICLYLQGWAELDELQTHIDKLKAKRKSKKI